MVFLIFLILLTLGFFVLLWLCSKTWRAAHVVALALVYFAGIGLAVLTALTIKTQGAWRSEVQRLERELDRTQAENERLRYGDLTTSLIRVDESVHSVQAELNRLLLERSGRVWRQLAPVGLQDDRVMLAAADDPERVVAIDEGLTVFAFLEGESPEGRRVPMMYVGRFQVAGAGTPVPLAPLSPDARQLPDAAGQTTWTLYEMLPLDGRQPFMVRDERQQLRPLGEEQLRQLMPRLEGVSEEAYEAMIASYLRDGQRATDQDPPENRWQRIRLQQSVPDGYTVRTTTAAGAIEVRTLKEVDAEAQLQLDRAFDSSGRAIVGRLRRSEPVQLAAGDELLLDEFTAQQLIADGMAELVEPVFVRTLNNYSELYHETFRRLSERAADLRRAQFETQQTDEAIANAELQTAIRQRERARLEEDVAGFAREREAIVELQAQLHEQHERLRTELSHVYRGNALLERELRELHEAIEQEIQRREGDVQQTQLERTASVP